MGNYLRGIPLLPYTSWFFRGCIALDVLSASSGDDTIAWYENKGPVTIAPTMLLLDGEGQLPRSVFRRFRSSVFNPLGCPSKHIDTRNVIGYSIRT